jgi:hypothetical protein
MFTLANPHHMHAGPIGLMNNIRDDGLALVLRRTGGNPQIGQKTRTNAHLRMKPRVLHISPAQIDTYPRVSINNPAKNRHVSLRSSKGEMGFWHCNLNLRGEGSRTGTILYLGCGIVLTVTVLRRVDGVPVVTPRRAAMSVSSAEMGQSWPKGWSECVMGRVLDCSTRSHHGNAQNRSLQLRYHSFSKKKTQSYATTIISSRFSNYLPSALVPNVFFAGQVK